MTTSNTSTHPHPHPHPRSYSPSPSHSPSHPFCWKCALSLMLTVFPAIMALKAVKTLGVNGQSDLGIDVYNFPTSKPNLPSLVVYPIWDGVIQSTGRNFTAYAAQVNDNSLLSFPLPNIGCTKLQTTLQTSLQYNCLYATNGGYFSTNNNNNNNNEKANVNLCVPNIIYNYIDVSVNPSNQHTNFGIDYIHRKIVIGYPDIYNDNSNTNPYNFSSLLGGAGWLIRQGKNYVNKSPGINVNSTFVTEKAPRTGIGIWKNGSVVLLQVDGEEDIKSGLDLFEFSELFSYLDVDSAVNFDGGGSSTSVYNGKVINKPTCTDNSNICQRNVSSIVCVRK